VRNPTRIITTNLESFQSHPHSSLTGLKAGLKGLKNFKSFQKSTKSWPKILNLWADLLKVLVYERSIFSLRLFLFKSNWIEDKEMRAKKPLTYILSQRRNGTRHIHGAVFTKIKVDRSLADT
jgi:hypothetical protein